MADVSLYLDEDVRVLLAEVLRNRGYSVTHALEAGKSGRSDQDQLVYAVRHKMALLTHNVKHFAVLAKSYRALKKDHYGIILSGQLSFNELLKRISKLLSTNTYDALKKQVVWLSAYKESAKTHLAIYPVVL